VAGDASDQALDAQASDGRFPADATEDGTGVEDGPADARGDAPPGTDATLGTDASLDADASPGGDAAPDAGADGGTIDGSGGDAGAVEAGAPSWTTQRIDGSSSLGQYDQLVRWNGGTYITFYDAANHALKLAYRTAPGAAWRIELVDDHGDVGKYGSLAVDSGRRVHVSYFSGGIEDLKYAVRDTSGAWSIETVDSTNRVGYDTAIAVDPSGGVHIRYYDLTLRSIRYAHRAPLGTFAFSTIASNVDSEGIANLIADASANLHTTYYDSVARTLRYARFSGGQWSTETVGPGPASPSSIAERSGTLYVSYVNGLARTVNVAVRDPIAGTWSSQTVDTVASANTSLDLDAQGVVHVAYFDAVAGVAKHARQNGAGWTIEPIARASGASINLRADVDFHVSFAASVTTGWSLAYAKTTTGGWANEIIDADNQVGVYPTLRVDSTGLIQVSHADAVNQDVRHTYRKPGGAWTTFKLSDVVGPDRPGDTSTKAVTMITDPAGAIAVCYCNASSQVGCSTAPSVDSVWSLANTGVTGDCRFMSLARDPAGPLQLLFGEFSSVDHASAAAVGATWSSSDLVANTAGRDAHIATDGAGGSHVVYLESVTGEVRHAYRAAGGAGWAVDTIEATSSVLLNSAIAVDTSGRVHAVYRKGIALRHASRATNDTTWAIETIDPSSDDGEVSLGLEPNGALHVVYFDSNALGLGFLAYAYKCAGGTWTSNPLNDSSALLFASLAIAGGTVHVAYFDASGFNPGLIYGTMPSACP
jgi:hypothetical protein